MISEKDFIYVTKKQASVAVASLTLFCLFIFMLGYFWGKQTVLSGLGEKVINEKSDDDYSTVIETFGKKLSTQDSSEVPVERNASEIDEASFDIFNPIETKADSSVEKKAENSAKIVKDEKKDESKQKKETIKKKNFQAILIGFGTKRAALNFLNRVKKHGIDLKLKTRTSKTASGKIKKNWYQIVTKVYKSRDELQELVAKVRKIEKIKESDIKIV